MSRLAPLRTATLILALCALNLSACSASPGRGEGAGEAPGAPGDVSEDLGEGDVWDVGREEQADAVDMAPSENAMGGAVDDILSPSFAPDASSGRCVGGVVVVVTPGDTLVRGYGATRPEGAERPGADTLFAVGSITKLFTGLGLAKLVADGEVTLETSAGELLGEDLRASRASWPTLGALITYHAGLPQFTDNIADRDEDGRRDAGIDPRSPAAGYAREHLASYLSRWSPPTEDTYEYSNVGIGLAGLAMQDHLGAASYHEVLRALVAAPLNMQDTWGQGEALDEAARARVARGYAVARGERAPAMIATMGVLASAGGGLTSGEDMARLLRALTAVEPSALDDAVELALTPRAAGPRGAEVGYAVEIERREYGEVYRKGGLTASSTAYMVFQRDPGVGVALMTSCGKFSQVRQLAEQVFEVARERAGR